MTHLFPTTKRTVIEKQLTVPHGAGRKKFTVKEVIERRHQKEEIERIDSISIPSISFTPVIILILLGFLLFRGRK